MLKSFQSLGCSWTPVSIYSLCKLLIILCLFGIVVGVGYFFVRKRDLQDLSNDETTYEVGSMFMRVFRVEVREIFGWIIYCMGSVLFWLFILAGILILRFLDISLQLSLVITVGVFIPFMYFRYKVNKIYELLERLDYSHYIMKKKMGLDTTPSSEGLLNNYKEAYMKELVDSCETFDEIRNKFISTYGINHWSSQYLLAEQLFRAKRKEQKK